MTSCLLDCFHFVCAYYVHVWENLLMNRLDVGGGSTASWCGDGEKGEKLS